MIPLTSGQSQAKTAVQTQQRITAWPYYSKIKFVAERVGDAPGPYTYVVQRGLEIRAFSYRVNGDKVSAGFTAADGPANRSDTNLTNVNQTTGGQNVLIHGIALQLLPAGLHLADGEAAAGVSQRLRLADHRFVAALWEAVSVTLSLNGDENLFRLGVMGMLPGAGGVAGSSEDGSGRNALNATQKDLGFATNGWPVRSNFFRVPEGLIWRNQSNADANFNLVFTVERPLELFSGGSPENNLADQDPVVDTSIGYAYPTELVCEVMTFLVGEVIGPRTRSA
jgi:hypothetical protein